MQRSISLYRALKNTRFSSTSPTRIFGDFWYVIEDMFLDQKPLKNLLLQLVAGWPTFCDKMPGLIDIVDHYTLLGNCPPTPPLSQHFALSEKYVLMLT